MIQRTIFILGLASAGLLLASTAQVPEQSSATNVSSVALEALERLKGIDLDQNPAVKEAVFKILDQVRGTPQFVQIVRDFNIKGQDRELLVVALNNSTNSTGVEAVRLILRNGNLPLLSD